MRLCAGYRLLREVVRSTVQVQPRRGVYQRKEVLITTVAKREETFKIDSDKKRDKTEFRNILERFKLGNPNRRGHVEFIVTSLNYVQEFQVHKDIQAYKDLFDLFPKKKMIAPSIIASEFWHFPRHQDTAIQLLDKMEEWGVCPDNEMRELVIVTFGLESHVFRKFCRMMYWMPKFKNASPYPLPNPVPRDPRMLARIAIERICRVDLQTKVEEFECKQIEESMDKTWIISGQSPKQRELLSEETGVVPVRIEGPSHIWLRDSVITYFTLMSEPRIKPEVSINTDDVSDMKLTMFGEEEIPEHDLTLLPSVHEQSDSTILGVCATGTSSRDSLLSWVRFLQRTNPCMQKLPVVFKLKAPSTEIAVPTKNEEPEFQSGEVVTEKSS